MKTTTSLRHMFATRSLRSNTLQLMVNVKNNPHVYSLYNKYCVFLTNSSVEHFFDNRISFETLTSTKSIRHNSSNVLLKKYFRNMFWLFDTKRRRQLTESTTLYNVAIHTRGLKFETHVKITKVVEREGGGLCLWKNIIRSTFRSKAYYMQQKTNTKQKF